MKLTKYISLLSLAALTGFMASCENGSQDFPDFDYTTVYFAYQNPIRTIVLGVDETTDVTPDNNHECSIIATMGGSYNGSNAKVQIAVDPTLVDHLYFSDGRKVEAMLKNYYSLSTTTLDYGGGLTGATKVKLNDAFFADPKSIENTYVIPVKMTSVAGADSILSGKPVVDGESPQLTNTTRWDPAPKNYTLYLVKYINQYTANYLQKGEDDITINGTTTKVSHGGAEVENGTVVKGITTRSLSAINWPVSYTVNGTTLTANLILTFDDKGNGTVTTDTEGLTVSGTASFVQDAGTWNKKQRQGINYDLTLSFSDGNKVATKGLLTMRDRGVTAAQEFTTEYKN